MKVLALIPILVEVALAMSPRDVYNQHEALVRRNRSGNRLPAIMNREFNGRNGRCSAHISSTTSSLAHTTTLAAVETTSKAPKTTTSSTTVHEVPTTSSKSTQPVKTTPPPTTTTHSTSAAAPSTTPASSDNGDTSAADISAYLSDHNTVRAEHGANALVWNNTLADAAQTWANKCIWQHSGGTLGPYGENLAAGSGDYSIASAISSWANEESEYDASNPVASHYTQMVWKATTQLGCAVVSCDLPVFTSNFWPAKYYVCEYYPQGNVGGEYAAEVGA